MKSLFMIVLALMFSLSVSAAEPVSLNQDNTVFLKDMVEDDSITDVMADLSKRETNSEPVLYLVLDTPGGYVDSGLNLIHFLKGFKKPVKTITLFAASMGFQIAEGNPGDRLIVDTGTLMSHPMSGGEGGQFGVGMSIENRTKAINETIKTMDQGVVARTNGKQTLESYQKAYDNELWTTGQNAVELGYADSVVDISCGNELLATNVVVDTREYIGGSYALDIKYEYSRCPLMLSILKYQITIVELLRNKKYIIENKGYEIPVVEEKKQFSLFDLFGNSSNPQAEVDKITAQSKKYKTFMLFKDRSLLKSKKIIL